MSHEVETLAYSGEVPWHGLGVRVDHDITPDEMLVVADLDWNVSLRPMHFQASNGDWVRGDRHALVRDTDERYLTAVGPHWKPTQNRDALAFFNEFTERGGMAMETAGSLKNGKHVFALGRFKREFEVVKGDPILGYLLFHNPHIFGKAVEVMETSVRVVCNNTLTAALGNVGAGKRYAQSHSLSFDMEEAKTVLGLAEEKMTQYEEAAKFLVKRKASKERTTEYFKQIFPTSGEKEISRNAQMAMQVLEYQPGVEIRGVGGTWWNAFNAVTYLSDHHLGRDQDGRMASAWFGSNRGKKQEALALAVEYAKAA